MRKRVLLVFIVILLAIAFFVFKVPAHHPWLQSPAASPYPIQPVTEFEQPADGSGSWYSPTNPDHRPNYYWYNSPQNSGWHNVYKNWWCW